MKPRVLVLATTYPRWQNDTIPGFVHELSKRLIPAFEVHVLAPHCAGAATNEVLEGVQVQRFRYAPSTWEKLCYGSGMLGQVRKNRALLALLPIMYLMYLLAALNLCRREKIDVIHAHWILPQGLLAAVLKSITGIPFIATCHGADVMALRGRVASALRRFVGRKAARIAPVSEHLVQRLIEEGLDPCKLTRAPMGVDTDHLFVPPEDENAKRAGLLFIGRLVPKKGLLRLIDAFAQLPPEIIQEGLNIIGNGPEAAPASAAADRLGISKHIHFVGAVGNDQLLSWLHSARALVAPFETDSNGDQEGLGLVVVEAMAAETLVITTDMPATSDVAIPNETAYVASMANTQSLAATIVQAHRDCDRSKQIAKAGRRYVEERFSWRASASTAHQLLLSAAQRLN